MNKIKMVVTDVDGTLMEEATGRLNPEYYEVIRQLVAQGIRVVIASGRPLISLEKLFRPVEGLVWFIADGGPTYKTTGDAKRHGIFPQECAQGLFQDIGTIPDGDALIWGKKHIYVPNLDSQMAHLLQEEYNVELTLLPDSFASILPEPVYKVALFHTEKPLHYGNTVLIPKWEDQVSFVQAGAWWIDCLMPNISKASALEQILIECGITPDEVMASGDNMNDVEMLRYAGVGLAVSSALPEVKAVATREIGNFKVHGVLNAWKELLTSES
ncbi:MAG: HAD-IIB family hydrolase [Eubacteriales bacterium]